MTVGRRGPVRRSGGRRAEGRRPPEAGPAGEGPDGRRAQKRRRTSVAAAVLVLVAVVAVAGGGGIAGGGDRSPVATGASLGAGAAGSVTGPRSDPADGAGPGLAADEDAAAGDDDAAGGDVATAPGADGADGLRAALDRAEEVLAALDGSDGARWESRDVEGDLAQAATDVLEGYRDGGASLAHAGYLDLLGDVWGCAVTGGDWAEVCVVREDEGGERCRLSQLHLDVSRWEELCEQ